MGRTTVTFRVEPYVLERLERLAIETGRSCDGLVSQALRAYLARQDRQIDEIKQGLAELDRKESIPHDQVMAEMEDLLAQS